MDFVLFKQKTAYEMRISDWSSDVCSSDLGFVYAWDGKKIGKGEQEITNIVEGERMDTQLRFKEPFESEASCYLLTEAQGESQTVVKWGISGKSPYPFNLMSLFFDMGNDFEEGLQGLKTILESR